MTHFGVEHQLKTCVITQIGEDVNDISNDNQNVFADTTNKSVKFSKDIDSKTSKQNKNSQLWR